MYVLLYVQCISCTACGYDRTCTVCTDTCTSGWGFSIRMLLRVCFVSLISLPARSQLVSSCSEWLGWDALSGLRPQTNKKTQKRILVFKWLTCMIWCWLLCSATFACWCSILAGWEFKLAAFLYFCVCMTVHRFLLSVFVGMHVCFTGALFTMHHCSFVAFVKHCGEQLNVGASSSRACSVAM